MLNFLNRKKKIEQPTEEVTATPTVSAKLKIGDEEVAKATETLNKYKQGKSNLESRIVENEEWWKLRHWEQMRKTTDTDVLPTSAWLFNCLANKHADAMDNYPEINCLPREEGDKEEAEKLKAILPVVFEQNDFEETYSDVWWYKLKQGCGVYGVFWNNEKLNGLGDIEIKKVDLLNLFWEPGITDIQKSPNLFCVDLVNSDALIQQYPQLRETAAGTTIDVAKYRYDDTVDTSDKMAVVDWYYKLKDADGGEILHFCKFCNGKVLFATENEPENYPNGWYSHGLYPFEFDVLFGEEGTPAGFGYIDICKDPQKYIDYLNQAFLENTMMSASPRFMGTDDNGINEKDFLNWRKKYIKVPTLSEAALQTIETPGLSNACLTMLDNKITELKETSGNRDVSTGGSTAGVTAASAIAAMQEAGSKLSRDMIKASYRAFKNINLMCIELIREFYDLPRTFRILGEGKAMQFVRFDNSGLEPQPQEPIAGKDMGYRLPIFDIEVSAQKASPYTKMAQNELALQFFSAGFFNPQIADQALACVEMMDFTGKYEVLNKIQQNGTLYQQMLAMQEQMVKMAAIIDSQNGTNVSAELGFAPVQPFPQQGAEVKDTDTESSVTKNARERVAESTAPA